MLFSSTRCLLLFALVHSLNAIPTSQGGFLDPCGAVPHVTSSCRAGLVCQAVHKARGSNMVCVPDVQQDPSESTLSTNSDPDDVVPEEPTSRVVSHKAVPTHVEEEAVAPAPVEEEEDIPMGQVEPPVKEEIQASSVESDATLDEAVESDDTQDETEEEEQVEPPPPPKHHSRHVELVRRQDDETPSEPAAPSEAPSEQPSETPSETPSEPAPADPPSETPSEESSETPSESTQVQVPEISIDNASNQEEARLERRAVLPQDDDEYYDDDDEQYEEEEDDD